MEPTPWLKLQPHFDAGFEPTDFGTSPWVAGALAARYQDTFALGATAWF